MRNNPGGISEASIGGRKAAFEDGRMGSLTGGGSRALGETLIKRDL